MPRLASGSSMSHPTMPGLDPLSTLRQPLIERLDRHLPGDGQHPVPGLPSLTVYRSSELTGQVCGVYEPCVALILQGSKQVVLGGETLVYDAQHYLVSSLDLPAVATLLEASAERPYLSLALRLDQREIAGLLLSGALPALPPPPRDARAMATGALTAPLLDAVGRLVGLLDAPADIPALAPLVQREIFYRLLAGELGGRLRQMAAVGGQGHQIGQAIAWLRSHYAEPLRVEELAREVRMSLSSFHHHFKALTALSPLQFQKQLRLTEARRLMLVEHLDAATAAYRVGYESASQFSREYSRQFGAPPSRDIAVLREQAPAPVASVAP